MKPFEQFNEAIVGINGIFEASMKLRDYFVEYFRSIERIHGEKIKYQDGLQIGNIIRQLENIAPSSLIQPQEEFEKLFSQAVVLAVSNSEAILKDTFKFLLNRDLESVTKLDDKKIPWSIIRDNGFKMNREDFLDFAFNSLFSDKSQNGLNFQNVLSIQQIFKDYFQMTLNLDQNIWSKINYYYQVRHAAVHNRGIVDQRCFENIEKHFPKGLIHYSVGEKVRVNDDDYEDCVATFRDFFSELEENMYLNTENHIL